MCIGIPGKVTAVGEDIHQLACADVGGVIVRVNIALVCEGAPQALIGQWVLIHAGCAMSLLDEREAQETLAALQQMQAVGFDRVAGGADALH